MDVIERLYERFRVPVIAGTAVALGSVLGGCGDGGVKSDTRSAIVASAEASAKPAVRESAAFDAFNELMDHGLDQLNGMSYAGASDTFNEAYRQTLAGGFDPKIQKEAQVVALMHTGLALWDDGVRSNSPDKMRRAARVYEQAITTREGIPATELDSPIVPYSTEMQVASPELANLRAGQTYAALSGMTTGRTSRGYATKARAHYRAAISGGDSDISAQAQSSLSHLRL